MSSSKLSLPKRGRDDEDTNSTSDSSKNTRTSESTVEEAPSKQAESVLTAVSALTILGGSPKSKDQPSSGPKMTNEEEKANASKAAKTEEMGSGDGKKGAEDKKNAAQKKRQINDVPLTFPQRLMEILSTDEHLDIISWLPHGRAFIIYHKKKFITEVLPRYFKESKFTSFTRKLNRWGFTRVSKGPETGAYYHELFQRGNLRLCLQMSCQKKSQQFSKPSMSVPWTAGNPAIHDHFGTTMPSQHLNAMSMSQQSLSPSLTSHYNPNRIATAMSQPHDMQRNNFLHLFQLQQQVNALTMQQQRLHAANALQQHTMQLPQQTNQSHSPLSNLILSQPNTPHQQPQTPNAAHAAAALQHSSPLVLPQSAVQTQNHQSAPNQLQCPPMQLPRAATAAGQQQNTNNINVNSSLSNVENAYSSAVVKAALEALQRSKNDGYDGYLSMLQNKLSDPQAAMLQQHLQQLNSTTSAAAAAEQNTAEEPNGRMARRASAA